ncbi:RusA family crossover junction endodeoxyribonuclease [Staphylococcus warneri]
MRTTAPDIDNLEKATFDSIFKGLEIKDSRIVMVAKLNFKSYIDLEQKSH